MEQAARVTAQVERRLIPLLALCYFFNILDRGNIGLAALTMNHDLGLSAAAFGFGAGVFFIPYFVFEVPSNLALQRFGARRWLARILVSWGLIASATAFVWDATSFYVVRAVLGAAEAGFFPGIVFYLTLWIPEARRGRIVAVFMAAIPVSALVGAPVGGALLGTEGLLGLHGWQWLFILEGVPAVLLGFVVLRALPDRPDQAAWLAEDDRRWLVDTLAAEQAKPTHSAAPGVLAVLRDRNVLLLALAYTGLTGLNAGLGFFLPLIMRMFPVSNFQAAMLAAIPFLLGAIGMVVFGLLSDRRRRGAALLSAVVAAVGLVGAAITPDPVWKLAVLSFACLGVYGCMPAFWPIPQAMLTGASAAAALALINAVGNLAGFYNPAIMGWLRDRTGNYNAGFLWLAATAVMALVILVLLLPRSGRMATRPPA